MSQNLKPIPLNEPEGALGSIRVFQLNDEIEKYEELEVESKEAFQQLFQPDFVILIVKGAIKGWIWIGANATPRMRFLAPYKVPDVKSTVGGTWKAATVDQGFETKSFKNTIKFDTQKTLPKERKIEIFVQTLETAVVEKDETISELNKRIEELKQENEKLRKSKGVLNIFYNP